MLRKKLKTLIQKSYYQNWYPPKNIKKSLKVLSNFWQKLVNDTIISGKFSDNLKLADVTPAFKKKKILWIKQTIEQLVFYRQFWKSLKNLWKNNWAITFKTIYIYICMDTGTFDILNKLYLNLWKFGKKVYIIKVMEEQF